MTTNSERKMAADILRSVADDVKAMPDYPTKAQCKLAIDDLFQAMKIIDEWWK